MRNYMKVVAVLALALALFVNVARADVYLAMMRGSNNRLDEANRDRANGNRLFDSQNNNRGGYNVGSAFYYVGEKVRFEWTNQHGCGQNPNLHCNIVVQYMCDDWLRDGTTTARIPNEKWADGDPKYGRHESYEWYQKCSKRQRNKGLFTASQNLNGETARFTRQNPNGGRRGFECPEERDYYPYWHPTPWRDIAVFAEDMDRCRNYFQNASQNVHNYGVCYEMMTPQEELDEEAAVDDETGQTAPAEQASAAGGGGKKKHRHEVYEINNKALCELKGHEWVEEGAWNIAPPECVEAPWTRVNHLGNTFGGETPHWEWTVPDHVNERCVLRMRYNISTHEYDGWAPGLVNATLNDREGLKLGLTEKHDAETPYAFKNNAEVDFGLGVEFELAINTAQFGRTFQDRSHRFAIRPRPDCVSAGSTIKSYQVRGRRGNIVQTFPATEYDFTPNNFRVDTSDWIHTQFTGSNTNNANDDGQGRTQSDRQNMVEIEDMGHTYPAHVRDGSLFNNTVMCHRSLDTVQLAEFFATTGADVGQFGGELSELDDAATYFDGDLIKIKRAGQYNVMCSRDNNFSNRQTKSLIVVEDGDDDDGELSDGELAGVIIGAIIGFVLLALAGVVLAMWLRKRHRNFVAQGYSPVDTATQDASSMYVQNS